MRGLAFEFRMWIIQNIYLHFEFGLRGLAIQIENGIIWLRLSVSERETAYCFEFSLLCATPFLFSFHFFLAFFLTDPRFGASAIVHLRAQNSCLAFE